MNRLYVLALALLTAVATTTGVRAAAPVAVSAPWSPPATDAALVYANITNDGDDPDRLIGAFSPSATGFELHDTLHGTAAVSAIVIPAHGTVTLAPGGRYLSLTGLKAPTVTGGEFFARLHFERAGWIVAVVRVGTSP
jgi:copper(I)-binding protein